MTGSLRGSPGPAWQSRGRRSTQWTLDPASRAAAARARCCVVVEARDDDLFAGCDVARDRSSHGEAQGRHVLAEHHFVGVAAEKSAPDGPGLVDHLARLLAGDERSACVRVAGLEVGHSGVDHRPRNLGAARSVGEHARPPVDGRAKAGNRSRTADRSMIAPGRDSSVGRALRSSGRRPRRAWYRRAGRGAPTEREPLLSHYFARRSSSACVARRGHGIVPESQESTEFFGRGVRE